MIDPKDMRQYKKCNIALIGFSEAIKREQDPENMCRNNSQVFTKINERH
jgi:hypothetical protein